jgi:hypothetical protein
LIVRGVARRVAIVMRRGASVMLKIASLQAIRAAFRVRDALTLSVAVAYNLHPSAN